VSEVVSKFCTLPEREVLKISTLSQGAYSSYEPLQCLLSDRDVNSASTDGRSAGTLSAFEFGMRIAVNTPRGDSLGNFG
jgi:hypothetical protein